MTELTDKIAAEIAERLVANGFSTATSEDVFAVAKWGSIDASVIGEDYDDRLTDAITEELDAAGIPLP